jgi:hypothetical protein
VKIEIQFYILYINIHVTFDLFLKICSFSTISMVG